MRVAANVRTALMFFRWHLAESSGPGEVQKEGMLFVLARGTTRRKMVWKQRRGLNTWFNPRRFVIQSAQADGSSRKASPS